MRPALPATVVITQARHPLEGRDLRACWAGCAGSAVWS